MKSTRQQVYKTKVSNAICDVPLTYVFNLLQMKLLDNVIRAHLRVAISNCGINPTKTLVDESGCNSIFFANMSRDNVVLTPDNIIKWILLLNLVYNR